MFTIDPLQDRRWRAFVQEHPQASVFHRAEWLQSLKNCYGYTPVALTFSPPETPLKSALLFCEVKSALTGRRLVSLPFSDHCEPLVNNADELEAFLQSVTQKVRDNGWKYAEIRPILPAPVNAEIGICQTYYFHVLNLRDSEEAIFTRLHKDSVQRKIRRAEREGLRYEEGSSEELLGHFYRLMLRTRRQQGLPPQPLRWFRALLTCMGQNAKIRVAYHGGNPVASILTLSSGNHMVYKYGCSDSRFNNLGGTAMLFWRTIQDAKASGLEEFDMGRTNVDNAGLSTFKERWGAQRRTINYWQYPAKAASFRPEYLAKHARRLISVAPDKILTMIGNVLYRHIG